MDTSFNNVDRVYSGRPGCMCGCRGKYTNEGRGVKIMYNKVMNHPGVEMGDDYAFVDTGTRYLAVYFKRDR